MEVFVVDTVCLLNVLNPFPNNKILDSSKLEESADDNLKVDENGTKFSKWLENTVGKGEIARYEQFLLFLQCFPKACTADTYKPGLVWERVNMPQMMVCMAYRKESIVGKRQNSGNRQFTFFQKVFKSLILDYR